MVFCGATWPVWVGLPFRAWFQVAQLGCNRWLTHCGAKLSRDNLGNLSSSRSVCVIPRVAVAVGLGSPGFGLRGLRFSPGRLQLWHCTFCGLCDLPSVSCFSRLPGFSSCGNVRSPLAWASATHRSKSGYFGLWLFGFGSIRWPNKSVKGTLRPVAFLEFWFFIKVPRLRFAFVSGAPLTSTLGSLKHAS